jgi:single-strand DNA-binding protein
MFQQITLVGNVGKDAEARYTPSGVPVTAFSLAVSRKWKDAQGNDQEKTTWFRVTTWRKLAEVTGEHVKKGMKVLVTGEIEEARPYTNKDGETVASLEVTAQNIRYLSFPDDGQGSQQPSKPAQQRSKPSAGRRMEPEPNFEEMEDIPF